MSKAVIAQIDQEINELEIRLKTLKELRARLSPSTKTPRKPRETRDGLPGPGRAVTDLVSERPGLLGPEVVSQLEGKISTKSEDQPRLIRNTLRNLTTSGAIIEREGRYYPRE